MFLDKNTVCEEKTCEALVKNAPVRTGPWNLAVAPKQIHFIHLWNKIMHVWDKCRGQTVYGLWNISCYKLGQITFSWDFDLANFYQKK